MIAEFYGLPGSGKTSTMNDTIKKTRTHNIVSKIRGRDMSRLDHIRNAFSLEYIRFVWLLMRLFFAKKNRTNHDFSQIKIMIRLYLIYIQERKSNDNIKIYCFDHGIIQTLLSFVWCDTYLRRDMIVVVEYVARMFSKSVIFVYAKNDNIGGVYARIVNRGEERRILYFNSEQAKDLLEFQRSVFDEIEKIIEKNGHSVVIDTQNELEDNVKYLLSILELYETEK